MSEYNGPMPAEMFATNTFAENLIKYHDGPSNNQIMDDSELAILQRFVNNPEQRETILRENGVRDEPLKDQYVGSLATYIVFKHGHGDVLDAAGIEKLRSWFAAGTVFKE